MDVMINLHHPVQTLGSAIGGILNVGEHELMTVDVALVADTNRFRLLNPNVNKLSFDESLDHMMRPYVHPFQHTLPPTVLVRASFTIHFLHDPPRIHLEMVMSGKHDKFSRFLDDKVTHTKATLCLTFILIRCIISRSGANFQSARLSLKYNDKGTGKLMDYYATHYGFKSQSNIDDSWMESTLNNSLNICDEGLL